MKFFPLSHCNVIKHSPHSHSQPVWFYSIRCQFGDGHQFDYPIWKDTSKRKMNNTCSHTSKRHLSQSVSFAVLTLSNYSTTITNLNPWLIILGNIQGISIETNLGILELFQFLSNRLIYPSKVLQLLQQKSSLPCNSALISGRVSGILNRKRKRTYNNGSQTSKLCLMQVNCVAFIHGGPTSRPKIEYNIQHIHLLLHL